MNEQWRRFISGEDPVSSVDPLILRSWKRCREKVVD
ncbi:transcriptional regulator of acetoin/glycerol metabolism [Carboxydothermus ferrireducens DSM 11255]|nr:transcriptional regulator of acetoin/glycerol metabolism [Carboxydothermus ferrireducens DSM 11255]